MFFSRLFTTKAKHTAQQQQAVSATRSLFGEILNWMLVPLLLLWPMSIAITYLVAKAIANGPFDRALTNSTMVLAQQVKVVKEHVTLALPLPARDILRADDTDNVYFQVSVSGGELLAGAVTLPLPPAIENTEIQGISPTYNLVHLRNDVLHGQEIRVAYTWVNPQAGKARLNTPPILVQVAETLDKRAQLAHEIVKGVILPQFIILPIAVILVWFGLTRGIRPLAELQQRLRLRRTDDLSAIDTTQAPEELTPLLNAFNDLLQKLDQSIANQKRFIADAAHQMKTPLAGLRMQAELAMSERDPEKIQHSLQLLAQSSERATRLINQLLALAKAESTVEGSMQFTEIDLHQLARDTIQEWLGKALEQRVDLGFEGIGNNTIPIKIMGNAMLLHELLNNLLDNAFRYAVQSNQNSGIITLRVGIDLAKQQNFIELEDNGPGIAVHERELVFERFYRVLGTNSDGSGLGLAIAREIAGLHSAQIEILAPRQNSPSNFAQDNLTVEKDHSPVQQTPTPKPPGTRFCISFPRLASTAAETTAAARLSEGL